MTILQELNKRKIIKQITNEDKFEKIKNNLGVYIGFDPTAKSLHLGNYIQIATLLRFKKMGYKVFVVIGGATGMIGDPSGKTEKRKMLGKNQLHENKKAIGKQFRKFGLKVIDNYNFYKKIKILNFIKKIGKLINVNYMINKEVVASRVKDGMSFAEFSYQLIQGYDFLQLYQNYKISIQIGGSDQWGNITTGVEIIRKVCGDNNTAVGITTNLLLTSSGQKFGKSAGNAIWLDPKMTSPYTLYQHILNTSDEDLQKIFYWLTFISLKKIQNIMIKHNKNKKQRYGQKVLGFEIVKQIHSEQHAQDAEKLTNALFGKGAIQDLNLQQAYFLKDSIPTSYGKSKNIQDFLVENEITSSKREAREFIKNGTIEINGTKIKDDNFIYKPELFNALLSIIKKGKKKFYLVIHKKTRKFFN